MIDPSVSIPVRFLTELPPETLGELVFNAFNTYADLGINDIALGDWIKKVDEELVEELFVILRGETPKNATKPFSAKPKAKTPAKKAAAAKPKPSAPRKPRGSAAARTPSLFGEDEAPKPSKAAERNQSEAADKTHNALSWAREYVGSFDAAEFASANGLSKGSAKGMLKRWIDGGLVVAEKSGRSTIYRALAANGSAAHP